MAAENAVGFYKLLIDCIEGKQRGDIIAYKMAYERSLKMRYKCDNTPYMWGKLSIISDVVSEIPRELCNTSLTVGDKFSSRNAQLVSDIDLPFDENRKTPDFIINPSTETPKIFM